MLISTKGRYALRVMVDLAEHQAAGRIPLKEIADRQGVSEKYIGMWRELDEMISNYLDGITVADLVAKPMEYDFVI